MTKLFGSTGVYVFSSIVGASIPFILLPILTRFLSPSDYGTIAMFQVLTGIVSPFVGLSIQGAIARQYYEQDRVHLPTYVTNALLVLGASAVVMGILLFVFSSPISHLAAFPRDYLWAVLVYAVGHFVFLTTLTLWQVQVRPVPYGAYSISRTAMDGLLSVFLVVGLNAGWEGRVQGQVAAVGVAGLLGLFFLWRGGWLHLDLEPRYVRNALAFGVPLIPHTLGSWAIQMTDRLLVTHMVGLAETGVYFAGVQIGMVILLLQDSFNKAWVPYFYGQLKGADDAAKRSLVRFTYAYDAILLVAAVAFGLLAPYAIPVILGDAFLGAEQFVFWIAIGYAFNGMYKMASNYFFFAERTMPLAWITALTAILNIGSSYALIRFNGAVGAAQGSALAFFVSMVLTWVMANRVHRMPWLAIWRTRGSGPS